MELALPMAELSMDFNGFPGTFSGNGGQDIPIKFVVKPKNKSNGTNHDYSREKSDSTGSSQRVESHWNDAYLIKLFKLLMDYANKNSIKLELNEKENKNGDYLLLCAYIIDNIKIVQVLMEYVNKNNNKFILNEKDVLLDYANRNNIKFEKGKKGWYPLLSACNNNNIEMIQLLLDYANKNDITLEYEESIIKSPEILTLLNNH
ncbi:hypothetical protein PIROE2DRAFT_10437 [Piromyces sp. E2]|nr:hypothetical protein PIROE2DRAFT_10437 [Piromyces sp. E2]|eukprot:OUM63124.1 hypothetical protein PIROE2DRAFT_10437 [Piromyces sp. E2]